MKATARATNLGITIAMPLATWKALLEQAAASPEGQAMRRWPGWQLWSIVQDVVAVYEREATEHREYVP